MKKYKIINDYEIKDICEMYKEGFSTVVIAKKYNIHPPRVNNILRKNNIKIRTQSETSRKYTLNEAYFDKIENQKQAYIIGLLYADGNNLPERNCISLGLQIGDIEILEKINQEIGSNRPISIANTHRYKETYQDTAKLYIQSNHISNRLNELGVVPNKSLILKYPDWLSDDLFIHMLRGYIDGDGCYSKGCISLMGTEDFCNGIKTNLLRIYGIQSSVLCSNTDRYNSNTKVWEICGINKMKCFCNLIYHNAELYMSRKYNKCIQLKYINNSLSA